MFEVDKVLIGEIYTTINSCLINSDSFLDEYEITYEPIRLSAFYVSTGNESLYNEYFDILNDKYYMDEYFSTNKHSLFVKNKENFMTLSMFLKKTGITYKDKYISKEELNTLLRNIFETYNDKNFNYSRKILHREKMNFASIKKSILILRCIAYNLESTIELLYKNGLKIDGFKMLLDNENINTYFPNVNKHEQLVMMDLKCC